mmetsp:Transcript_77362/g.215030  ORF Transcript_77362/g.215030 Transcript_77362/m.215030 type:complete len:338 (-) Transcript_77362:46-1059(-)
MLPDAESEVGFLPRSRRNHSREVDVCASQNFQGLLQGLDFFLAAPDALLICDTAIDACRLKLVMVSNGLVQLLLGGFQLLLDRVQRAFFIRLQRRLMLGLVVFQGLVLLRLEHERLVCLLRGGLTITSLNLQTSEVRQDHFEKIHHSTSLGHHTLVRRIERLRCVESGILSRRGCPLQKRGGLRRLRVVVLDDGDSAIEGGLSLLGLGDGLRVVLFRRGALGLCGGHRGCKLGGRRREVADVLSQLRDLSREALFFGRQPANLGGLRLARHLVRGQLRVAPTLVLRLGGPLLHQLRNQIFDHLFDLLKRIGRNSLRHQRQHLTVATASAIRQERRDL